jgi:AcrR family transcriptional regulator
MTHSTAKLDTVKLNRHTCRVKTKYHHGDLANSLVAATVSLLETRGLAQLSLREVAREAGVSHAAPAHHFGDKSGLLTAVAIEGYKLLEEALLASQTPEGRSPEQRLLDAGYAYIQFALSRTAYFEVMFRPALTNSEDPEYISSSQAARNILEVCVRDLLLEQHPLKKYPEQQIQAIVIALWSQVHGFANLWLAGNLGDITDTVRRDMVVLEVLSSLTPKAV